MKIKNGFVLREVAGTPVVLPVGQAAVDLSGMLSLNNSGVLLWKALEEGSDREALADVLLTAYEVERAEALADVDEFIEKLTKIGCVE